MTTPNINNFVSRHTQQRNADEIKKNCIKSEQKAKQQTKIIDCYIV
jgi:hypothetical protein